MGEVLDQAFIQPLQNRPKQNISEAEGIPVIDLSSISSLDHLSTNNVTQQISDLVTKVGEACEKWGFFQVINHGVPLEKLEKLQVVAREFFGLPLEEKRKVSRDEKNTLGYYDTEHTKNVRDWKEVFDFGVKDPLIYPSISPDEPFLSSSSRWPTNPSDLRDLAQDYAKEVEKLAFKLMELIALSLGLPPNRLNDYFKDSTANVRLNYYPPCTSPDITLGVGQHKDPGALAILAQDSVGGLQVLRKSDGEWVKVNPITGAFVVNVGDIFQVWSNDKYESVEHRAMVNSEKERLSVPFFFNPAHHVMVKPLEELTNEKNQPKYGEYNWGVFYVTRNYGNLKKFNVENLQISHFKIG